MTKFNNDGSIAPLEFDLFFGLDVDKKSVSITILDHAQKIRSLTLPNNSAMIINYIKRHFPHQRVVLAYEAGPTGYGLYDDLTKAGYPCLVVTPSLVPTQAGKRVKTNRLDSGRLAQALRGGELKGIRIPSRRYRDLRHLVQCYKIMSQKSRNCKCRIKALLLVEGLSYPNSTKYDHWSHNTIKKLQSLSCQPAIRFKLDILLENLRFCRQQLAKIQKAIRDFCRNDDDLAESMKFLTSLPGIGGTIAPVLLARIGDWRGLRNVRELGGFLGLTPCEHSTGEDIHKGNITRQGDSYLRNLLVEGAWSAVAKDPDLADFYQRIYQRHPPDRAARKAIVAVARKLTARIYAVLTQRRIYTPGYQGYNLKHKTSDKKRRLSAPEDASTLRRRRKCVITRIQKDSPALVISPAR